MQKIRVKIISPLYKKLYLTDLRYNKSILNLDNLADKTKEEKHTIAIKGAYASAKKRKQKQILRLVFTLDTARENYNYLLEQMQSKYKDKEYLTIKDSNKLETYLKRVRKLEQELKTATKEYRNKYKTNYLLNWVVFYCCN